MTQEAVGDSARRRLRAWQPRQSPDDVDALVGRDALATSRELQVLLQEIDALRLGLAADLGLAASAIDAAVPDVARDVLAGAQDDLARFALRAELELRAAADGEPVTRPGPLPARRVRRLTLLAPAVTAAAALVGLLAGVVPSSGQAVPERSMVTSAAASYAELFRLHESGAPTPRLARAARQLHAEVARLVEVAGDDPAAARQALRLLELEVRVLQDPQHGGALDAELAESQRLLRVLRRAALGTPAGVLLAGLPLPTDDPSRPPRPGGGAVGAGSAPDRPVAAAPAPAPTRRPAPPPGQAAAAPGPAAEPAPATSEQPAEQSPEQEAEQPTPSAEPAGSPAPGDPSTWFPTSGTSSVLPG